MFMVVLEVEVWIPLLIPCSAEVNWYQSYKE